MTGPDLSEETTVYAQLDDNSVHRLGEFSSADAVHDALAERFDEYVGRITLFTDLDRVTLPRPFDGYTDSERAAVDDIVEAFSANPHVADASTASPGGVSHVSRLGFKLEFSARDYDFTCYFTPDEPDVIAPTDMYDRPDKFANTFDALADRVRDEQGLDHEVMFVGGETYVPGRGARHHNTRLYGRFVPDDPSSDLAALRAFQQHDRVADAIFSHATNSPRISWLGTDGSRYFADEGFDIIVAIDEPREPILPADVDDYDATTSSSSRFDHDELMEWGETLLTDVAQTTGVTLSLVNVGSHLTGMVDVGELPLLAVDVHDSDDDSGSDEAARPDPVTVSE